MPVISPHLFYTVAVLTALIAIPSGLTLKRIGFSPWWALLCFIPVAALLGLWLLAFTRWPRDAQQQP